jgi:hypothetical protein
VMKEETHFTQEEAHLHFAKTLNGETWRLLDQGNRSREDDDRMLAAAYASYYHWLEAGKEVNQQRGEYMIARVYLAIGNPSEALAHAKRCLELTDLFKEQMADFDLAFAHEMFARANAANNQLEIARIYRERAQVAGDAIQGEEDRQIFLSDLNSGNWFGL